MGYFSESKITNKGKELIERSLASKKPLLIKYVVIADKEISGNIAKEVEALNTSTAYDKHKALISSVSSSNNGIVCKVDINNENNNGTPLTESYRMRVFQLMAMVEGDSKPVLLAYAYANEPDFMPRYEQGKPVSVIMNWFLKLKNSEQLEIKIDNTLVYALASDVEALISGLKDEETVLLSASGWTSTAPYRQTVNIPRMKSTASLIMGKAYTKDNTLAEIENWDEMASLITSAEAQNGSVVFYCKTEKPTVDFRVKLKGAFS